MGKSVGGWFLWQCSVTKNCKLPLSKNMARTKASEKASTYPRKKATAKNKTQKPGAGLKRALARGPQSGQKRSLTPTQKASSGSGSGSGSKSQRSPRQPVAKRPKLQRPTKKQLKAEWRAKLLASFQSYYGKMRTDRKRKAVLKTAWAVARFPADAVNPVPHSIPNQVAPRWLLDELVEMERDLGDAKEAEREASRATPAGRVWVPTSERGMVPSPHDVDYVFYGGTPPDYVYDEKDEAPYYDGSPPPWAYDEDTQMA